MKARWTLHSATNVAATPCYSKGSFAMQFGPEVVHQCILLDGVSYLLTIWSFVFACSIVPGWNFEFCGEHSSMIMARRE